MSKAEKISKAIEDMWMCCEEIRNSSKCEGCPMSTLCLYDTPLVELADLLSTERVREFIHYAENA